MLPKLCASWLSCLTWHLLAINIHRLCKWNFTDLPYFMHTNLCVASLLVYNPRARTKETFASFTVHLRVVVMVITVAFFTTKVVCLCLWTLIEPCQVGFSATIFVSILSMHASCCSVTMNLTAWQSCKLKIPQPGVSFTIAAPGQLVFKCMQNSLHWNTLWQFAHSLPSQETPA